MNSLVGGCRGVRFHGAQVAALALAFICFRYTPEQAEETTPQWLLVDP